MNRWICQRQNSAKGAELGIVSPEFKGTEFSSEGYGRFEAASKPVDWHSDQGKEINSIIAGMVSSKRPWERAIGETISNGLISNDLHFNIYRAPKNDHYFDCLLGIYNAKSNTIVINSHCLGINFRPDAIVHEMAHYYYSETRFKYLQNDIENEQFAQAVRIQYKAAHGLWRPYTNAWDVQTYGRAMYPLGVELFESWWGEGSYGGPE